MSEDTVFEAVAFAIFGGSREVWDRHPELLDMYLPVAKRAAAAALAAAAARPLPEPEQPQQHQPASSFGYAYCAVCKADWPCHTAKERADV